MSEYSIKPEEPTTAEEQRQYDDVCFSALRKRIAYLEAELAKHQESEFHPDWSMLEATRASLREHQTVLRESQAREKVPSSRRLHHLYVGEILTMKLTIELVPSPCWEHTLRKILPRHDWEILQQRSAQAVLGVCQICNAVTGRPECHEIWEYDDHSHIQTLKGVQSLCQKCHMVKHYNLACRRNQENQAFYHYLAVNRLAEQSARTSVEHAKRVWGDRCSYSWTLDLSWLISQHIPVPEGY